MTGIEIFELTFLALLLVLGIWLWIRQRGQRRMLAGLSALEYRRQLKWQHLKRQKLRAVKGGRKIKLNKKWREP